MKMLIVILTAIYMTGCQCASVVDDPKYSNLIFKQVWVKKTCFIAQERDHYIFLSDRDEFIHQNYVISREDRPTYEEFLSGKWTRGRGGIRDIIVAGEALVISDIIKKYDFETGALLYVYGSFLDENLRKKYDPVLLGTYSEMEPIILKGVILTKLNAPARQR